MLELAWKKHTPTTDVCHMGIYSFKRKRITGVEEFEIWKGESLEFKTFRHGDFIRKVRTIIDARMKGKL